jgi:hypothetical protein
MAGVRTLIQLGGIKMTRTIAVCLFLALALLCISCAVKSIGPKEEISYDSWENLIITENLFALASEHNVFIYKQNAKWKVPKADPIQFTCKGSIDYRIEYFGYCNGNFVVVNGDCMFTSQDGSKWQYVGMKPASIVSIMYYNNNYYIICEDGLLLVSPRLGDNDYLKIQDKEIDKIKGAFIRNKSICAWSIDKIYQFSFDDGKWSLLSDMRGEGTKIYTILQAGPKYFMPSSNKLLVSDNLIHWHYAADCSIYDIAEGNGTYLAVGYQKENDTEHFAFSSADGYQWKPVDIPSIKGDGIRRIAYSGNSFIAVGTHRVILESKDGVTWVIRHKDDKQYRRNVEVVSPLGSLFKGIMEW